MNYYRNLILAVAAALLCFSAVAKPATQQSVDDSAGSHPSQEVEIIIPAQATSPESIAAAELAHFLRLRYPNTTFIVENAPGKRKGTSIQIGTPASAPELMKHTEELKLQGPESYVVTTSSVNGTDTGIILGADPVGVVYGVHGILEKLGGGSFISSDTMPGPQDQAFSLDQWKLENHPLQPERIVFNWHNFLSGCTTWDLADWRTWVAQSQKSGFNTIMVHAYANNPMFTFEFNGKVKPVGFVATTHHGRDWGINHLNDIRRGSGGFLFDDAEFGSEAAKVPFDQRVEAKQTMMRRVFEYAEARGVKINFALDIDTSSANPQSLIESLPEPDRFKVGKFWMARPDTAEGYKYYKAQAEALFDSYPQIDTLSLWRRRSPLHSTVLLLMKEHEMPDSWQKEYRAHVAANPAAATVNMSVPNFAIAKVYQAWRRALNEMGRESTPIATGSWEFKWIEGAVEFLPAEVQLIPLDYQCMDKDGGMMSKQKFIEELGKTIEAKRLLPIIWAHHDDGTYVGAPLPFLENFNEKLKTCGAGGFGIIHWMTQPLDPYFSSHVRQTWAATENESTQDTCGYVAERWFGSANAELMSGYLQKWMADMPTFGRETTEFFIDRPMSTYGNCADIIAACKVRIELLDRADTDAMTNEQKQRLLSFRELELFVIDCFETQTKFDKARDALSSNQLPRARDLLANCWPGDAIARYAGLIRARGATRGEEGLVATMNTRWVPHYVRIRQAAGLEAVRYNYAPTSHESHAQLAGTSSFWITPDHAWWQVLGQRESQCEVFTVPEDVEIESSADQLVDYLEICRNGIESDEPLPISFAPIVPGWSSKRNVEVKSQLPAGKYRLKLIMLEPTATRAGERVMKLQIGGALPSASEIDIFKQAGGKNRMLILDYPVEQEKAGTLKVTLIPVTGKALVCGAILEPVDLELESD